MVRELSREPAMFSDWIVGRGTEFNVLMLFLCSRNGRFESKNHHFLYRAPQGKWGLL